MMIMVMIHVQSRMAFRAHLKVWIVWCYSRRFSGWIKSRSNLTLLKWRDHLRRTILYRGSWNGCDAALWVLETFDIAVMKGLYMSRKWAGKILWMHL